MKPYLLLLAGTCVFVTAEAQNPNWAEHVAPILYQNCTKCHNTNGIAGFSLISYTDASNWKYSIKHEVNDRTMPPWPPDVDYRRFAHERILTDDQIKTITDWVDNGAPEGDPSKAPAAPTYSSAATLTNPDLVLQMPAYTVNTGSDLYRCFVLPANLVKEQSVTDIEVIPGNKNIVHHVLVFQDSTQTCINLDNADPGEGYTNFGGVGSNTAQLMGAWVPGGNTNFHFPDGMGITMSRNSYVVIQVHYPAGVANEVDSTKVLIKFDQDPVRQVGIAPVLNHGSTLTNGPLVIPKNTTKTFYAQYYVPVNASLLFVGPHMHLIGRRIKCWAVTATKDTIPIINIEDWDFHWQGMYAFKNLLKIPAGSVLYSEAYYDNTLNNPEQPNNPPKDVFQGESTTDEMMLIYFGYVYYQAGDENISQELSVRDVPSAGLTYTPQLYDPYPNPSSGLTFADFYLPAESEVRFDIIDINGKIVFSKTEMHNAGIGQFSIDMTSFSKGCYSLNMSVNGIVKSKKIMID